VTHTCCVLQDTGRVVEMTFKFLSEVTQYW